jgi:F-type H+-transporting ATPase subunit b
MTNRGPKSLLLLTTLMLAALTLLLPQRSVRAQNDHPTGFTVSSTNPAAVNIAEENKPAESPKESPSLLDQDLGTALATILIFVALLVILRFTAWKPILAGLKGREEAIRQSIEAATRAKEDADRTTKELNAQVAEAQKAAAAQIAQAKTDATRVADAIRKQAETDANALRDRTVRDIDAAKQQALAEINQHAAELGTAIATKILQRTVTVDDQRRLVDESLAQLGVISDN